MRSWGDVFPWLADAHKPGLIPGVVVAVDIGDPPDDHLRALIEHIRTRLLNWTFAEILPHATQSVPINLLNLSNRSFNSLTRNIGNIHDLRRLDLADVVD